MNLEIIVRDLKIKMLKTILQNVWDNINTFRMDLVKMYKKTFLNSFFFQGFSFVIIFSLFQISTITCLFMMVSTNVSNFYDEEWLKRLLAFVFLIFSIYYTGSLYVITITAENAFKNLKQLVDPLRKKLGIYQRFE